MIRKQGIEVGVLSWNQEKQDGICGGPVWTYQFNWMKQVKTKETEIPGPTLCVCVCPETTDFPSFY